VENVLRRSTNDHKSLDYPTDFDCGWLYDGVLRYAIVVMSVFGMGRREALSLVDTTRVTAAWKAVVWKAAAFQKPLHIIQRIRDQQFRLTVH
jgi:hypothetical protein